MGWFTVSSPLPQEQNIFYVILYDSPRLIRFSIEPGAITSRFGKSIRNFMPKNRRQRVETKTACPHLNVSVKGENEMSANLTTRHTNIANNATNPSPGNKYSQAFTPNIIELFKKGIVG